MRIIQDFINRQIRSFASIIPKISYIKALPVVGHGFPVSVWKINFDGRNYLPIFRVYFINFIGISTVIKAVQLPIHQR